MYETSWFWVVKGYQVTEISTILGIPIDARKYKFLTVVKQLR